MTTTAGPEIGCLYRPSTGQDRLVVSIYRKYEVSYRSFGRYPSANVCSLQRWLQWQKSTNARIVT